MVSHSTSEIEQIDAVANDIPLLRREAAFRFLVGQLAGSRASYFKGVLSPILLAYLKESARFPRPSLGSTFDEWEAHLGIVDDMLSCFLYAQRYEGCFQEALLWDTSSGLIAWIDFLLRQTLAGKPVPYQTIAKLSMILHKFTQTPSLGTACTSIATSLIQFEIFLLKRRIHGLTFRRIRNMSSLTNCLIGSRRI